jgi:hypothetical protein
VTSAQLLCKVKVQFSSPSSQLFHGGHLSLLRLLTFAQPCSALALRLPPQDKESGRRVSYSGRKGIFLASWVSKFFHSYLSSCLTLVSEHQEKTKQALGSVGVGLLKYQIPMGTNILHSGFVFITFPQNSVL